MNVSFISVFCYFDIMVFINGLITLKDLFDIGSLLVSYFLAIAVPKLLHCMIFMSFFHLII